MRSYDLCTKIIISSSGLESHIITLCIHFSSSLLSVISLETSGEHNEAVISVHQPGLTCATPAHFYNEASKTQPAKSDQPLKSVISAHPEPQSGEQKENGSNQKLRDSSMWSTVSLHRYREFHFTPTHHLTDD